MCCRSIPLPDFESPTCVNNTCTVSIIASDGVNSTTQTITITVADVNSPQFTSANTVSVPENTTDVIIITATDDEVDTITYTLDSTQDAILFVLNADVLSFKTAPDFESPTCGDNTCTVSIIASNGVNSTTQTITITVADVNSPQFTSANTVSVPENTTDVIIITATDDEGDTITYALGSDNDASLFIISSGNILSFKTAPDFESPDCGNASNTCSVIVTASDGGITVTQTIAVTITNVNDNSPQFTSSDSVSIPENTVFVTTITTTDADDDTISYTLGSDNDEILFNITANNAAYDLEFSTAPDYETPACGIANDSNTCSVTITASDGVNTTTQTITVIVTDECDDGYSLNPSLECLPDDDEDGVFNTEDVDDDNDGLIEIHTLDMLHHIRYNLAGTDYKSTSGGSGNTSGAPEAVTDTCSDAGKSTNLCGYELSRDLDFDSSSSYVIDSTNFVAGGNATSFNANDSSRTSATNAGWEPIGNFNNQFSGVFDGNHYAITNLYLNRDIPCLGLFAYMSNATIRNLGLLEGFIQANTPDNSNLFAGMLVCNIEVGSAISNIYATGNIADSSTGSAGFVGIGGLIGSYSGGTTHSLRHSYADVNVDTAYTSFPVGGIGGLVGRADTTVEISDSYASGAVSANAGNIGGFNGVAGSSAISSRNYSIGKLTNASGEAGFFVGNTLGAYADNFYDSDIDHAIGGTEITQLTGISGATTAQMQLACTAADITAKTGICALGCLIV